MEGAGGGEGMALGRGRPVARVAARLYLSENVPGRTGLNIINQGWKREEAARTPALCGGRRLRGGAGREGRSSRYRQCG